MGIILIKYSQLRKYDVNLLSNQYDLNDALTIIKKDEKGQVVNYLFYNDFMALVRQRFSISHEIWHIVNPGSEKCEYDEKTADHFARSLLVPKCILINEKYDDYLRVSSEFDVSSDASNNALISAMKWSKHPNFDYTEKEKEFLKHIKK